MRKTIAVVLLCSAVAAGCVVGSGCGRSAAGKTVHLYCAAGLQPAMKPIIEAFSAETGVQVQCDYGGSGTLLTRLKLSREGDLFLPAEQDYVELAKKDGLVESERRVCEVLPVILVKKGNPKDIRTLADLARPGLKLGLGNPQACQVGRVSEELFAKNGVDAGAIRTNTAFQSTTVNDLGLQMQVGQLDAVIVWDAIAAQYAKVADAVAIPREKSVVSHFVIALLTCSKDKPLARKFMDFLVSPKAQEILRKQGYST